MENDRAGQSLQQQLHEIERGESASWIVYPPTPWWWPVSFGLWAAVFTLVVSQLDGFVESISLLGLVALMGLAMVWDRRRRGTYPSGSPPRELWPAIAGLTVGAAVVAGLAWLAGEQLSVWLAVAVAAVGAWAVVAWYEHTYAGIAARLRERAT